MFYSIDDVDVHHEIYGDFKISVLAVAGGAFRKINDVFVSELFLSRQYII